ncbi:porin family protein [Lacibacter sediminis]|uniref:PorT family protein n=1 Tax=Lacibacter sediminis TaxID=2760713 RepID=A0A7G5XCY3_9BACT|nr:porin family protein [Lacibacter sediminis]QNA43336.1 PorT family protein [Lacibacter sediminis]
MKFQLSAVLIAMVFATAVQAQHVNIGIKAGLNLYNIKYNNDVEYDMKPGLHAGLLGHIHITKNFAVQPELLFSSQGAKYKTGGETTKLNLNYLNVPILLQYMFDNGFRIEAGPQVGFLLTAKVDDGTTKTDVKSDLKPLDVGLGLGIGYIHVPSGFGVDARYNLGLSNINDEDNSSVKANNRGFQVGVFYQFKHK